MSRISISFPGIKDPVRLLIIQASHPTVDPWLSFRHHTLWWIRGFPRIVPSYSFMLTMSQSIVNRLKFNRYQLKIPTRITNPHTRTQRFQCHILSFIITQSIINS
ncbi:hypothetical protein RHMOL_Rhmol01G0079200 [Rhododendron molle]|uniref:Uncharacterized protein n=1 Tax=Rhododendron molle TaxID=49168 RepID=A0ACC0Q0K8_RHOML|nr:hypothetical protein RHMOL_Rhmol01G0079200 [Rhododendron molle]